MSNNQQDHNDYILRQALIEDVPKICEFVENVYPEMPLNSLDKYLTPIQNFPEGQFLIIEDAKIIAYGSSVAIKNEFILAPHTLEEVINYPLSLRQAGDYLYITEICVDSSHRHQHLGSLICRQKKMLCKMLNLKGIVAASRMCHFYEKIHEVQIPEKYVEHVIAGEINDEAIKLFLHLDFKVLGCIPNYLPEDKASLGFGVHFIWNNCEFNNGS